MKSRSEQLSEYVFDLLNGEFEMAQEGTPSFLTARMEQAVEHPLSDVQVDYHTGNTILKLQNGQRFRVIVTED